MDKDIQMNPVMFIANDKQTIYLSSYGKRGERGKDIYIIRKIILFVLLKIKFTISLEKNINIQFLKTQS